MALACDLRFAAEGSYRLGLPEVTLGLLPGNGGTQRLPRLMGANKALEMMLTGETVTPERALELGIINRIFPPEKIEEKTEAYADKLAQSASQAVGSIKQAVNRGIEMDLKDGLGLERDLSEPLFDSEDAKEGLTAFMEKRPPVYKGR